MWEAPTSLRSRPSGYNMVTSTISGTVLQQLGTSCGPAERETMSVHPAWWRFSAFKERDGDLQWPVAPWLEGAIRPTPVLWQLVWQRGAELARGPKCHLVTSEPETWTSQNGGWRTTEYTQGATLLDCVLLPRGRLPSTALVDFEHPAVGVFSIKQKRKELYFKKKKKKRNTNNTHKEIE